MKHKTATIVFAVSFALALLVGALVVLAAQTAAPNQSTAALSTGFTYQGQLKKSSSAVTDRCDMDFSLWTLANGGLQIGADQIKSAVPITNGLFTVQLNDGNQFGSNAFTGSDRYLQVAVKCTGDVISTTLGRQQITAAPYALYAVTAGSANSVPWTGITGQKTFYYPLLRPVTLNLEAVDPGLKGFAGGFTDGRYGYFVPNFNGASNGKVARIDLQNYTASGVVMLDLATADAGLVGFGGGFANGRYGYFAPDINGKVARVDLQNFTTGGVVVLDLTTVDPGLKGFAGGFTDGRYGYFVPNNNGSRDGKVARVDLQNFTTGGVTLLDLAVFDAGLKGFWGGSTDGRYAYFVPNNNGSLDGNVARVDLQNFAPGGVITLNLALIDSGLTGFVGGFTDGHYAYLAPNNGGTSGKVARIDLQNFTAGGVTMLDLTTVNAGLKSFLGGFTDGRYGYFLPFYVNGSPSGLLARVDLQNFTPGGVVTEDLAATDAGLKGFLGGFTDGRYAYLVPDNNITPDGIVARILLPAGNGAP